MLLVPTQDYAQRKKKNKRKNNQTSTTSNGLKPYSAVITASAETDEGLFKTHKVKEAYYFELPDSLLNREMLLVSRIAKIPANLGGGYVNAGSKTNEQVVHWERFDTKILLRVKSYAAVADSTLAISKSVAVNNYEPILYSFDIKSISPGGDGLVIDVSKFFTSDVPAISGLNAGLRKRYKVKRLDANRTFINSVKSFPLNIEVKQEVTFEAAEPPSQSRAGTISLQMNHSMILLPKKAMQPRIFDPRVGFFTISQTDYGSMALKSDQKTYIRRWNLIPKDVEAYQRGELVEPVKPIVYYLDEGTPEYLRPYIKQGIEDWQKAFETAGFKNAIIAKDPPTKEEDPEFSPEDVRYSVVRYVASTTRNAVGPSVSDPRSGEIIESDIIWYHNHLRSYRNRYLLETGAANPSARTLNTSEAEIGEMMRMVIAHEVGHALGFPHNMAASNAYDVESYRDSSFTQQNGIAASIMDYARYNYIAQPGDENIRFIRQLGPYDHYAVNWGYRYLPEFASAEAEQQTLNSWIKDKEGDPKYVFGRQSSRFDPASKTEDISNNSIQASTYGLKNLKLVAKNLPEWTSAKTNDYQDLEELYGELLGVWSRYVGHVAANIGGVHENIKMPDQPGKVYEHVDEATQKASMQWLAKNAFNTPDWLVDPQILQNIDHAGYFERLRRVQARHLNSLLSFDRIGRLIDAETFNENYYSASEMFRDLRSALFFELKNRSSSNIYRRNLQKSYVERMEYLLTELPSNRSYSRPGFESGIQYNVNTSDLRSLVRGELKNLRNDLQLARAVARNTVTRYHYDDLADRIKQMLNPK
ncbi:zinc-dependent metalloprotease [Gangjinia marincola]|uniref:Zinc-dependent metalloprotease n=2 Tax=Gangjinia marincola TaxID=578463 RepID=A0ABN1MDJ9_9FLAO